VVKAINSQDLVVAAVLSGNRNFEGRIHPYTLANYLASPPLVVAYALAGTVDIDLMRDPVGIGRDGDPVYLREIWPGSEAVQQAVATAVTPEMFRSKYADVYTGNETWNEIEGGEGALYDWDPESTYVQEPPFFLDLTAHVPPLPEIRGARVLAVLGDSLTTDHISPAGAIPADSPAGWYLQGRGVTVRDFNTYGARRGNHEVMMRGTFGNIRLKNRLVPGVEGGYTVHFPDEAQMSIYDAAMDYQAEGVPLLVLAGKEYGTGSSRDWAAKGSILLGVKAVIAESYERIHRSNLVGMGVLPLQYMQGENADSLGLDGHETYDVVGLEAALDPVSDVTVRARKGDGREISFRAKVRIDTAIEVEYYRNGGILHKVLRDLLAQSGS
jgi:aconitate hydratase